MFRTDFNHLLQTLDSSFISNLMIGVSTLGMTVAVLLVIIVITSTFNFRRGIILMNIVGWMALTTVGLKAYFDYPRPYAVDATIKTFDSNNATETDLTHLQPQGFFDDFSTSLLVEIRSQDIGRRGFPSGHVILISGLWLGIALLFRKKGLWYLGVTLVVLTMLSRIYLGVHYLGDVIGGLVVAILLLLVFNVVINRGRLLNSQEVDTPIKFFLLAPLLMLILIPFLPVPGFQTGSLIGLNLAYLFILKGEGHPQLAPGIKNRFLSLIIYAILYLAMYYGIKLLNLPMFGIWPILVYATLNTIVLLGIYLVGKRLNIYLAST